MTKAERKWDQGELDLFSAGRAETPSSKSAAGVLAALGLDGSPGPGGGEDAPVSGFHSQPVPPSASAPLGSGIFSRPLAWVGGGILLALVPAAFVLGGSPEANDDHSVPSSSVPDSSINAMPDAPSEASEKSATSPDSAVVQLAELAEEPSAPRSSTKRVATESAAAAAAESGPQVGRPSLGEELAIIKQARDRLSSGDMRGAEAALSQHAQRFQPARLASEARVIRVEILMKQGKTTEAKQLAAPLMTENSPYRARMETLLSSP
jgi:hypothetical protein